MQMEITENIQDQDATLARLERLMNGATVTEATADIADENMRCEVCNVLLSLYTEGLIASLELLGVLNCKQVEELQAYFHVGSKGSGAA